MRFLIQINLNNEMGREFGKKNIDLKGELKDLSKESKI